MDKILNNPVINLICSIAWFYLAWGNFSAAGSITGIFIFEIIIGIYMLIRTKMSYDKKNDN